MKINEKEMISEITRCNGTFFRRFGLGREEILLKRTNINDGREEGGGKVDRK